jgi:hypothetical protein
MSVHCCMHLRKDSAGLQALLRSMCMTAYSRQRERRDREVALVADISPGGNSLSCEEERFDQTSYKELSL